MKRVLPSPFRYVAVPRGSDAVICLCTHVHRDPYPALRCVSRHAESDLIVRCVRKGQQSSWPLELYTRVRAHCLRLGLKIEHRAPSLVTEHWEASAQQSLAFEPATPAPLRSGHPLFMKARSYE